MRVLELIEKLKTFDGDATIEIEAHKWRGAEFKIEASFYNYQHNKYVTFIFDVGEEFKELEDKLRYYKSKYESIKNIIND